MDAIPEYQLFDHDGKALSNKVQGGVQGVNFITNDKVNIALYKEPRVLVWDLRNDQKRYVQESSDDELHFYRIYGALDTKADGTSAAHYKSGLVLIDSAGKIAERTYTNVSFDPAFSRGKWSSDGRYLALNYAETQRIGIWHPDHSSFFWLDPKGWVAESYAWSLDGHHFAFSGRTENNTDVIVQIVDGERPETTRDTVYTGTIPIIKIVFLPGDKTIAIADREGNVKMIEISSRKEIASAHQEGIDQLYSTQNAFYSSSGKDFRVWSTRPAPAIYWVFSANEEMTYLH